MTPAFPQARARRWALLALAALVIAALGFRYRGIAWPALHPDEPTIAGWASWTSEHPHIEGRFYAEGFFELVKPAVMLRNWLRDEDVSWQVFEGADPEAPPPMASMTLFLRTLNVWLAALTVIVFYALARRVTGSRGAALAAAAFLALSRLHIDHSHYAETDIAMLLTVALALALWARLHDGGRFAVFLAAAFVTGWAIGTKFTTTMLVANVVVGAVVVARRVGRPKGALRAAAWIGVGLVVCIAGILYTNRGILDVKWFLPHMSRGLSSVYAERSGLLSQAAVDPHAAWLSNWNTVRMGLAEIGWAWGGFMLVGLGVSLAPAYRRFWPVTWLFPILYGVYVLWIAPWVRGQEFMGFYPVLAVWAAIGVREVIRAARRTPYPRGLTALASLVLAWALAGSWLQASRLASQFGYADPRLQAMTWLTTHAPLDAVTGTESYCVPTERIFGNARDLGQIEWTSHKKVDALKLDYLLRNATSTGRGSIDPRTHRLYPEYEANLLDFESRASCLATWGALGDAPYSFVGHRMEWWEVRQAPAEIDVKLPLFRPLLLDPARVVPVPAAGCDLGSLPALDLGSRARRVLVNGPADDHRTLYVVLQTLDRPADALVSGLGVSRRAALASYDVAVVPVRRPAWLPRWTEYDVLALSVQPVKNLGSHPCYGTVAFSPEEAAFLLYQKGYADRALAFLKDASATGASNVWLTYVCAVGAEDWALAASAEPAARALLAELERARGLPPERVMVNGHTGRSLADHRRIRLPQIEYDEAWAALPSPPQRLNLDREEGVKQPFEASLALPVRLPPGPCRVAFTLSAPRRGNAESWTLAVNDSSPLPAESITLTADGRQRVVREWVAAAEQDYALHVSSAAGGAVDVSDLDVEWGGADLFEVERLALQRALIRRTLQAGDRAGAAALLAQARAALSRDDLGLDRLDLDLLATEGPAATNITAVAQRILRSAPKYAPALAALAAGDAKAKALCDRLKDGAAPALTIYPWLRLVRLGPDPATGRRQAVFEVLRDGMPALKVRAWCTKARHNDEYFARALGERAVYRGERLLVEIPPSPETGTYAGTWITVDSPPVWLPASLPVPGASKGRIPLE